jgi:phage-related protein
MMQVVIANRLRDGLVAFLDAEGHWAHFIEGARVARSEAEAEEIFSIAEKCEENNEVIDPMLIDVVEESGSLRPTKLREAIRAAGPTNRPDLGKQAEH